MSISYVSGKSGANSTADITTQVGDLLVAFAWDESNTLPTIAAGWTEKSSSPGTNNNSAVLAFKIATSTTESSGTFTGADNLIIQVYRSDIGGVSLGALSSWSDNSFTNIINYQSVSLDDTDGSSWVAGFAGHRSNNVDLTIVPTGWSNRVNRTPTTSRVSGCDSSTGVVEWLGQSVNVGGSSSAYKSIVVELLEVASSVVIDDVTDPLKTNSQSIINGSGYEAIKGTGSVSQKQGAKSTLLTIDTWSDTQLIVNSLDVESTLYNYGTHDMFVESDGGDSATKSFESIPATNNDYVNIVSLATSGDRITAIPDLETGDQLRYQSVLHQGGSPTVYTVTVNDDATFSISGSAPDGNYTFEVVAWDKNDETWGSAANQNVTISGGVPVNPPSNGMAFGMKRNLTRSMKRPIRGR